MNTRKTARIPVIWEMSGILEIPYVHPEELAELIKLANLPKGKVTPKSFKLDLDNIDAINNPYIAQDIAYALDEI